MWFDETVEYYYSKFLSGIEPVASSSGVAISTNMYERIISTFQPPLYNLVMFIWLNLGDFEWWFRFLGVIMGIINVAGIYKSIDKVWNYQAAPIAVVMLACTKWFVFYIQECAEYNLMLVSLSWFIFAWICLMEKVTPKRIIFF